MASASSTASQPPSAPRPANRLAAEKSPYLLQHAHNPVAWYAWGDEAFRRARSENKPIFLSVGYSTCHWCHVMERESFEDEHIAQLLNEHFVSVKVDREERPDVDRIYMTFVQATSGGGGWPMSVWLTPELKPFFGGTYFPPRDAYGRPGFATVLRTLAAQWRQRREDIVRDSERIMALIARQLADAAAAANDAATPPPAAACVARCLQHYASEYDAVFGGFGGAPSGPAAWRQRAPLTTTTTAAAAAPDAPKFPTPVTMNFLLHQGGTEAVAMAAHTLEVRCRRRKAAAVHQTIRSRLEARRRRR